MICIAFIRSRP